MTLRVQQILLHRSYSNIINLEAVIARQAVEVEEAVDQVVNLGLKLHIRLVVVLKAATSVIVCRSVGLTVYILPTIP